jgi:choline dehydrogenase
LKKNHTLFNGCTVRYTPEDDPCLKFWIESGHKNLYSLGIALFMTIFKSVPALPEPDMMIYWVPGFFRGFFHGFSEEIADIHNALSVVVLKTDTASRGTVRLTGNHPQDPLKIEKHRFEAPGGQQDIVAIREAIKVARSIVAQPNITMHVEAQVFPGPNVQTNGEIEDHILENVFGTLGEL